jgi:nucleoside-diphosphate-sugar epimerase
MEDKPNVLVLGGVGFIGRNFVKYLVDNNLANKIRAVDKVMPETGFLGKIHKDAFAADNVEYKQGNLTSPASIAKCFDLDDGKFDLVFNCAAETKYSQTEEVYKEKILQLSIRCATEAAKRDVTRYVELSTAQVYEAKKSASKETDKTKPWTGVAKFSLQAEQKLKEIDGLKLNILRPAIVYGPGDVAGLAPRLICGAVYVHLGEKMKFLWGKGLGLNTVHVTDVCKAMWHVATKCEPGTTFNLADSACTTQGSVNQLLEKIFGIETGFLGTLASNAARLNMKFATEEVNNKHLKPWSELCKKDEILNTPLTPYLDMELLYNNPLSVNGSAIEATGFKYDVPEPTVELLQEEVDYFVDQKLFPKLEKK